MSECLCACAALHEYTLLDVDVDAIRDAFGLSRVNLTLGLARAASSTEAQRRQ